MIGLFILRWHGLDNFKLFIKHHWRNDVIIIDLLDVLREDFLKWNKEDFGHIRMKKRELLVRLRGIQCSLRVVG